MKRFWITLCWQSGTLTTTSLEAETWNDANREVERALAKMPGVTSITIECAA